MNLLTKSISTLFRKRRAITLNGIHPMNGNERSNHDLFAIDDVSKANCSVKETGGEVSVYDLQQIILQQGIAINHLNREVEQLFSAIAEKDIKRKEYTLPVYGIDNFKVLYPTGKNDDVVVSSSPRIIIYGISKLEKNEIFKILYERLLVSFNIKIKKSDVTIITSNTMDELRKMSPAESLKTGKYDYIIVAPHPHSVKGKNIKHNWERFLSIRNIRTKVLDNHKKPLSKELLNSYALEIGHDLFSLNVA